MFWVDNQKEVPILEKIPQSRYAREFREEAARVVLEDRQSVGEVSARRLLPKFTLENWVRAAKAGNLGEVGKNREPLYRGRKGVGQGQAGVDCHQDGVQY